jgi:PKD repeat protein
MFSSLRIHTIIPSHTYNNTGIYTVTLTTTDTLGLVSVLQMDSIVRVSGPRAGFIVNQVASCTTTQINLVDTSTNAMSWEYSFGDGTGSTLQNPSHIYNTGLPNYIITQTVSDTMGCSSSISTSIFANFVSPLIASETEVCGLDTVHFFTSLQNYASYLWDFGDGTTSAQTNPSHVYTTEGSFNVNLTVTDLNGCVQTFSISPAVTVSLPTVAFSTTGSRQGCNIITIHFTNGSQNADSYFWEFGDGEVSSLFEPVHTYYTAGLFDVTLTVVRGNCVNKLTYPQYIRVDTAHAEFSFTKSQDCIPMTVTFTDLSVNPVSWFWKFGDGDTSSVQNPVHIYTEVPCCYTYLFMTDINGCRDTAVVPYFFMLNADFTTSADSGCFPFTVQFTDHSYNANNYFWDFGDGTTSTLENPTHTYSQPGTYDVTLISTSIYTGCVDTMHIPAKIKVKQPEASFYSTDLSACAPSIVNFFDQSIDAENYLWDFGDGSTSSNANPTHIYNTPGSFTVSLIVSSSLGCSDTITFSEYIQVLGPVTNFTASAIEGCDPFRVTFTDHSINAVDWNWSFGDGYSDRTGVSVTAIPILLLMPCIFIMTPVHSQFRLLPRILPDVHHIMNCLRM